jgi:hypothetical protein
MTYEASATGTLDPGAPRFATITWESKVDTRVDFGGVAAMKGMPPEPPMELHVRMMQTLRFDEALSRTRKPEARCLYVFLHYFDAYPTTTKFFRNIPNYVAPRKRIKNKIAWLGQKTDKKIRDCLNKASRIRVVTPSSACFQIGVITPSIRFDNDIGRDSTIIITIPYTRDVVFRWAGTVIITNFKKAFHIVLIFCEYPSI